MYAGDGAKKGVMIFFGMMYTYSCRYTYVRIYIIIYIYINIVSKLFHWVYQVYHFEWVYFGYTITILCLLDVTGMYKGFTGGIPLYILGCYLQLEGFVWGAIPL